MTIAVVFEREGTVTVAASKVLDTEMDGPQVSPEVAFPATSELFQTYWTYYDFVVR